MSSVVVLRLGLTVSSVVELVFVFANKLQISSRNRAYNQLMRRRFGIPAFVLLLASMPVAAQHGGGHAGGGHAGFSGGHSFGSAGRSAFSGVHVSSGPRSSPGVSHGFAHAPSFAQRGMSRAPFVNRSSRGPRIRTFASRNNCFGCRGRYIYPYAYGGFYDPYWWWSSDSSDYQNYDEEYERNRAAAGEMNQQSLDEQQMRQQQEEENDQRNGNRDLYTRSSEPASEPPQPATLLVFRDQHKQEVRNYAIVGPTLWSFGQRTEKIPLSDLDLTATAKANDERGLTFHIPAASEAQ